MLDESLAARFWSFVDKGSPEDCWNWVGSKVKSGGYGQIGGRLGPGKYGPLRAHRVSWIIANGSIPDNMDILHKCDNPACVNPRHLFLGTAKTNAEDMIAKGRSPRSYNFNNGKCRISEATVEEIRGLYATGLHTHRSIAAIYGINHSQVGKIVNYKARTHLYEDLTCV